MSAEALPPSERKYSLHEKTPAEVIELASRLESDMADEHDRFLMHPELDDKQRPAESEFYEYITELNKFARESPQQGAEAITALAHSEDEGRRHDACSALGSLIASNPEVAVPLALQLSRDPVRAVVDDAHDKLYIAFDGGDLDHLTVGQVLPIIIGVISGTHIPGWAEGQ